MNSLDLESAALYRNLVQLFGADNVIFGMSLHVICGGEFRQESTPSQLNYAKNRICLFTILDPEDEPKMVIELLPKRDAVIEAAKFEHQLFLEQSLEKNFIRYVTISEQEILELMDPGSEIDLCKLLTGKIELDLVTS